MIYKLLMNFDILTIDLCLIFIYNMSSDTLTEIYFAPLFEHILNSEFGTYVTHSYAHHVNFITNANQFANTPRFNDIMLVHFIGERTDLPFSTYVTQNSTYDIPYYNTSCIPIKIFEIARGYKFKQNLTDHLFIVHYIFAICHLSNMLDKFYEIAQFISDVMYAS